MKHFQRGTVIDVHHAILPLSGRLHPSTDKLLAAARPLSDDPTVKVLGPLDLVLHSAAHLFHEGEFDKGLRGLVDIDRLLLALGCQAQGWADLVARAHELALQRPLFYALRYTALLLGTPVPTTASQALAAVPGGTTRWRLFDFDGRPFFTCLAPDARQHLRPVHADGQISALFAPALAAHATLAANAAFDAQAIHPDPARAATPRHRRRHLKDEK